MKERRATYRPLRPVHVFRGYVHGERFRDTFGWWWVSFTTENGARFGAVPADEVTTDEDERLLCGECSDDMGVTFDEWPSALEDIPESDRLKCEECGA